MMDNKTPSSSLSPPRQVKKESEEEIKEYAETAMNELLGWYGYERLELRRWAASRAHKEEGPDGAGEGKEKDECTWCNKSISSEGGALQQGGAAFCSEVCFSQSRRANFKRAKTCDWCRHVRHTVAYVDFQDGATQLQFCSDKCLNQYKMHIFCRETQAHLDLNPHLATSSSTTNLITPELWLKNCRSRSASPTSHKSPSPETKNDKAEPKNKSPLPLITVASSSKLMKPKRTLDAKKESKNNKINLRKRRLSKTSSTVTSQTMRPSSTTPKAQDLRMCSPSTLDGSSPISTLGSSAIHSPTQPINQHMHAPFPNPLFGMPAPVFTDNIPHGPINDQRFQNIIQPRPNFMMRPGLPPMMQERPRIPLYPAPALSQAPPVTVLVPYPVPFPIPIPIPIPLPLTAFLQANCATKIKTEAKSDDAEGPLDFTMNSDKKREECRTPVAPSEPENKMDDEELKTKDLEEHSETNDTSNPEQTLPKFKITRLGNKMAKIVSKPKEPLESSRPLRKRRRLVEVATDEEPMIPESRKTVEV